MLVRMLEIGSKSGLFNLACANPHTLSKTLHENVEMINCHFKNDFYKVLLYNAAR